jgi:hypothetical protein
MTAMPAQILDLVPRDLARLPRRTGGFVAVVCFGLLDYWEGLHPPCLHYNAGVLLTAAVAGIAFLLTLAALREKPRSDLVWFLRAVGVATVLGSVAYLALFVSYTLPLPGHYTREITSWSLTPEARSALEGPNPQSVREQAISWDSDLDDHVFTGSSLAVMRAVFVTLWVLVFLGLGAAAASAVLLSEHAVCAGVYQLDRLGHRVQGLLQGWPQFAEPLGQAYRYIQPDPKSSLTKTRLILEELLVALYKEEMKKEPRKPLLADLLNDHQFTRKLAPEDGRVVDLMNEIRWPGNRGPHPGPATPGDAAGALDKLCDVLDWAGERQRAAQGADGSVEQGLGES